MHQIVSYCYRSSITLTRKLFSSLTIGPIYLSAVYIVDQLFSNISSTLLTSKPTVTYPYSASITIHGKLSAKLVCECGCYAS